MAGNGGNRAKWSKSKEKKHQIVFLMWNTEKQKQKQGTDKAKPSSILSHSSLLPTFNSHSQRVSPTQFSLFQNLAADSRSLWEPSFAGSGLLRLRYSSAEKLWQDQRLRNLRTETILPFPKSQRPIASPLACNAHPSTFFTSAFSFFKSQLKNHFLKDSVPVLCVCYHFLYNSILFSSL